MNSAVETSHPFVITAGNAEHARVLKRYAAEKRFRAYGIASILVSILFLAFLLGSIITNGYPAFMQTRINLPIFFDPQIIDPDNKRDPVKLADVSYDKLIKNSLKAIFPEVQERRDLFQLYGLISKSSVHDLRKMVIDNPEIIGTTQEIWLLSSADIDVYAKGEAAKSAADSGRITENQKGWLGKLKEKGAVSKSFNVNFFVNGDSRDPEQAGILGALVGSIFTILICIAVSFPVAVGAAIYLEEFAPKNRWIDAVEVGINNLAAVPSIVFGLLGLAIFLGVFHMPRSSALVGGMTLSLLVLPIIVIATRNSLKTVPPSIRDAATAMGASPMQVLTHHTLPLAMPGIMTGTIIGIARAIGETAPLLMIGMVAFVVNIPTSLVEPATSITVQIYLWADSPEAAFVEKTSAAIIILLAFLAVINATAVYLRKRLEYKW